MLEMIAAEEVKRIAELARAAREARDRLLGKVPDEALGQPVPAKGEHDPAVALGLDPLPTDHPARVALQQAIDGLPAEARRELLALMWIGRNDYGVGDWERALAAATTPFDVASDRLTEEPALSAYLLKALYEMKLL